MGNVTTVLDLSGWGNGMKLEMGQNKTLREKTASFCDPPPAPTPTTPYAQEVGLYQWGTHNLWPESAAREFCACVLIMSSAPCSPVYFYCVLKRTYKAKKSTW